LELALVRACAPETDPTPAGVVGRLERLERLANVTPGAEVPPADVTTDRAPRRAAPKETIAVVEEQPAVESETSADRPAASAAAAEPVVEIADAQLPVPQAADAASVDVAMLRRSWGALIQHLGQRKQMVLRALMESATPTAYDGTTLEIAFPPSFKNTVKQVESREDAFRQVLQELFGISPAISCVVRESRSGDDVAHVEPVEEDDAPGDDAEALRRVQEMLGAEPLGTGDGA
jgi:DNA polymerase-3 subunit gamma/tau